MKSPKPILKYIARDVSKAIDNGLWLPVYHAARDDTSFVIYYSIQLPIPIITTLRHTVEDYLKNYEFP